jgi:hypothetical protein
MVGELGALTLIDTVEPRTPLEARCDMTLGHIESDDNSWYSRRPGNAAVTLPNAEPGNMLPLWACQEG